MAAQTGILTTNGRVAEAPSLRPAPAPRPAAGSGGDLSTARRTFRVLTANVQSVPRTAITLAQAREDLRLSIKRKMVGELRHDNIDDEPLGGQPALDQP